MRQPSVGRDVHYVSEGSPLREDGTQKYTSECRAAKITAVSADDPSKVRLVVFNPEGLHFNTAQHDQESHTGGTWHWPEMVGSA